jgi:hypothetical protein
LLSVPPCFIAETWPHIAHFIKAAFASGHGDDTAEAIKIDVFAGSAVLWVVWDGTAFIAAATTKVMATPGKRICVIACCGGKQLHRWCHFITDLENYARAQGCDALRIMGRPGWKAVFPDYREPWVCLQKELR